MAPPASGASGGRPSAVPAVVGWAGLAGCLALGVASSGLWGGLLLAGLYALAVSAGALIRGRVRWARLPSRAAGGMALVASLAAVSVGGLMEPSQPTSATVAAESATTTPGTASSTSSPSTSSTSTPPPSMTSVDPVAQAQPGTVLALLGSLTVKGRGPMTGYTRAAFGQAWADTDHNGCDQRNDTLRRDLHAITLAAGTRGCVVMTGTLSDPYTARQIAFSRTSSPAAVQIDHVVALGDAWVTGAAGWDLAQRSAFANDPLNLVAVGGSVNEAKGDGDAATWLPPDKAYRCAYVARQVAVKAKYGLSVTVAERAAAAGILGACAPTVAPKAVVVKLGGFPLYRAPVTMKAPQTPAVKAKPAVRAKVVPKPAAPPKPQAPTPVHGVHPGAFCAPQGALGLTVRGTLMRCSTKPGDSRARWRSA